MGSTAPAAAGNGSEDASSLARRSDNAWVVASQDLTVFRAGQQIGLVRARGAERFEAIPYGRDSLGLYNSEFAAARALIQARAI